MLSKHKPHWIKCRNCKNWKKTWLIFRPNAESAQNEIRTKSNIAIFIFDQKPTLWLVQSPTSGLDQTQATRFELMISLTLNQRLRRCSHGIHGSANIGARARCRCLPAALPISWILPIWAISPILEVQLEGNEAENELQYVRPYLWPCMPWEQRLF